MHANIQAICSGTFVIQTSHMACNDEKKNQTWKNIINCEQGYGL